jgi:DNA-binding transcriptional LysR family regulator
MEIYQLRAFVTVAELGHLTKASEKLHLSQPALSGQIRALEEELGLSLFARSPSGMSLTRSGQRLLKEAQKLLADAQQFKNIARGLQGQLQGQAKVGTVSDPVTLRLGEFLTRMVDDHPLLEIDLHQEVSGLALDQVRDGKLDATFYFGDKPQEPLVGRRLRGMAYRVVAPAGWKSRLESADWDGVAAMPWIMTPEHSTHSGMLLSLFRGRKVQPRRVAEADQEQVITNLVVSGVGLSLVREEVALRERDAGRLVIWDRARVETSLWFAYADERATDPVIEAMLGALEGLWVPALEQAMQPETTAAD